LSLGKLKAGVDTVNFTAIETLKNKLEAMRPLTADEMVRLRGEFCVNYTYNSNAIEGNTLTLSETELVLERGMTIAGKPVKEHLELIGHRDAFDYIMLYADKNTELSERVIRNIHSLVLMDNARYRGVWRDVPVRVGNHIPPQPYMIAPLIEKALGDFAEYKKVLSVIEAAARFHLEFETIHPFIDGNGRTGRLITNFELVKAGYLPIDIKFTDRRKYYDCFDEFTQSGNYTKMTELFAKYEEAELRRYIEIAGKAV
jgi:Fic family protein